MIINCNLFRTLKNRIRRYKIVTNSKTRLRSFGYLKDPQVLLEMAIRLKLREPGFFSIIFFITFVASFRRVAGEEAPCEIGPAFLPSSS
jgi:hypothetical protein